MSCSCARCGARSQEAETRETMLEIRMEDCVLRGDSTDLVSVLRGEGLTSITLSRLDQLVTKSLSGSGLSRVQVVLKSLGILSENKENLQSLIEVGLMAKVLSWFEAVRVLLTSDLQETSTPLLSLTEEFYDYLLLLSQAPLPAGPYRSVQVPAGPYWSQLVHTGLYWSQLVHTGLYWSQLVHTGLYWSQLVHTGLYWSQLVHTGLYWSQLAIRTLNSILESLSREQRRLIQNDSNLNTILLQVAAAVLTAGDYELQVSLSEALCRLTPKKDREQRASHWFSSRDISSAFCDIRDGDFEVDCRHFLNFVNSCHGDQRRVYTFPCLRAFLDSTELFRPKDEKLDEFWIDFNLSSGCVSFFIDEPQGFLWGSVHLLREEVDTFSVQLKHQGSTRTETVLSVRLKNPIMHHNSRGQTVELSFNTKHQQELEEVAERVFQKVSSSPHAEDLCGSAQQFPSVDRLSGRSYGRKKQQSKTQLKILPLSSPSSEEESSMTKTPRRHSAEFLFDQIRHSTPKYHSGVPVGAGPHIQKEQTKEFEGRSSPFKKEELTLDRKRSTRESGYLSDQTEGVPACKKRAEPEPQKEEPNSVLIDSSAEEVEPVEQGEGLIDEWTRPHEEIKEPLVELGVETKSDVTSGVKAAFNTFTTHLETHFSESWKNIEAEVLLSLKECQQQVSSLLTAVHQQRLLLLQRFELSVNDQLKNLQENSSSLNDINTQILSFFQSETQRLCSFCDEHLHRLKTLESRGSRVERPNSQ
ncbi:synaptonemal complex protein 2-like [Cheilinus undulatus]|uniref:synaptonemal complex protein 2-like n=1 Tax=Cheilinus undulatus TaxID=241271 RepID=UPI001BD3F05E|nr:synaptonemal complex protein 2-like [Cheilinus undulatus]